MWTRDIARLRTTLGLSRAELARFLGVSEATIVRWESDRSTTAPKGLQAMLLRALLDAVNGNAPQQIAHVIRSSGTDHRSAVRIILDASDK